MLKIICRLFLGLVVCAGSACVTPTHASSASPVLLIVIQASGAVGAKDELIGFYNNSSSEQDITGWCLQNKAAVAFSCFGDPLGDTQIILPAFSSAITVSAEHAAASGESLNRFTRVFPVTNQSSGSLVGGSDTVTLITATGTVVDSFTWTSAHSAGKAWARTKIGSGQGRYVSTGLPSDWQSVTATVPLNEVTERTTGEPDEPQPEVPHEDEVEPGEGSDEDDGVGGVIFHPQLTELLANPDGVDTGQEFIELYNLNESAEILLDEYTLRVGPSLEKSYTFPVGSIIPPLSYRAFTNSDMGFTLVNSVSSLQLQHKGMPAGQVVAYSEPPDGKSWAMIGEVWEYVETPTPGTPNVGVSNGDSGLAESDSSSDGATTVATANVLKPCAANQYRSLETNRCRLIRAAASSAPTPCKQGQVRNAITNRCRNSASASTEPAACKAGQERNAETNRCRNVIKMTDAGQGVKGASVQLANVGVSLYAWLAIGGVVLLVIGYAFWEWRHELTSGLKRLRQKFRRRST